MTKKQTYLIEYKKVAYIELEIEACSEEEAIERGDELLEDAGHNLECIEIERLAVMEEHVQN